MEGGGYSTLGLRNLYSFDKKDLALLFTGLMCMLYSMWIMPFKDIQ